MTDGTLAHDGRAVNIWYSDYIATIMPICYTLLS